MLALQDSEQSRFDKRDAANNDVDLLSLSGLKMEDGKYVGFIVNDTCAGQFLLPEDERKVYDVQPYQLNALAEGDRIFLLSRSSSSTHCQLLAVLEFQGNVNIKQKHFNKHYNLHRMSPDEFATLKASWTTTPVDVVYGWHFELVNEFSVRVRVDCVPGCDMWQHFKIDDIYKECWVKKEFR